MKDDLYAQGYEAGLQGPFCAYTYSTSRAYRQGYQAGQHERLAVESADTRETADREIGIS